MSELEAAARRCGSKRPLTTPKHRKDNGSGLNRIHCVHICHLLSEPGGFPFSGERWCEAVLVLVLVKFGTQLINVFSAKDEVKSIASTAAATVTP